MSSTDTYSIYKFTNKITEQSYIGKTKNIQHRYNEHKSDGRNKSGFYFHDALHKYGFDNFSFEIIFQSNSNLIKEREFTDIFERHFIKEFKSHVSENGYNLTFGGDGFDSELAKYHSLKQIEEGTHPFLKDENGLSLAKRRANEGTLWCQNQTTKICEHCNMNITLGNYSRWHGDNCKLSPNYIKPNLKVRTKYTERICPHCSTIGNGPNMTRYHFGNCKIKSQLI